MKGGGRAGGESGGVRCKDMIYLKPDLFTIILKGLACSTTTHT